MANQSGGGRWAHVEGDHLVDDSGRIRDPSEIDVDRLEQIVMLPVSALPTPAPQIDSNGLAADLTSRLSALPAPNIDVGRLNVGLSALPAPNIDVGRLNVGLSALPAPNIDVGRLNVGLSALPAPNIDVGRLNVGLSALPAPNIDVERLAGSVDRIPDSGGHA